MSDVRARPRSSWRRLAALVLLVVSGFAAAQADPEPIALLVDGRPVGEARTDLVAGSAYAPIDQIAAGLGARLAAPVGGATAALTLAGHVVVIDVVEIGSDAGVTAAIRRDGRPLGDLAAVRGDDAVWGPVAPLVRAFGGSVAYLPDERSVVVVTPRAQVSEAELLPSTNPEVETLRIRLDAPLRIDRFDDPALGRTEFVLARASLDRARTIQGDWMSRIDLIPGAEGVRIRVDAPGADLEAIAIPDGNGTDLRIRATARQGATPGGPGDMPSGSQASPTVVVDPGFSAVPPEWRDAVLELAQIVAAGMRGDGIEVELTRTGASAPTAEQRLRAAAGADLLIALQVGDLAPGELRLWILGEAGEQAVLDSAVRRNAAEALSEPGAADDATDALRRELLLGLVPDLGVGRRAADALASALFQLGGFRAGTVGEAPLAILAPAAGRGVLIEVAPDDLTSESLAEALATAIASVALGGR